MLTTLSPREKRRVQQATAFDLRYDGALIVRLLPDDAAAFQLTLPRYSAEVARAVEAYPSTERARALSTPPVAEIDVGDVVSIGDLLRESFQQVNGIAWVRSIALTLLLVMVLAVLIFSNYVLDLFPEASELPIKAYIRGVIYALLISVLAWGAYRLNRRAINWLLESLRFAGFYPEWAAPMHRLVAFLLVIFAAVIAFPYLPGADSQAFQGILLFLGFMISLGLSAIIANIMAGVVVTYMRPFQVGDRVKIADTVGDVIEKTLLVTRIRTAKNVDVTIPNALALANHIINYSSSARDPGLILHTTITIGYDVPHQKVHDLLTAVVASVEIMSPHFFALRDGSSINIPTEAPGSSSPFRVRLESENGAAGSDTAGETDGPRSQGKLSVSGETTLRLLRRSTRSPGRRGKGRPCSSIQAMT